MYETWFRFTRRPFNTVPHLDEYFPGHSIEDAAATLARTVTRGTGPALLVGATGTGKTLLCMKLLANFVKRTPAIQLCCAGLSDRRTFLQSILFEFGRPYRKLDDGELRLSLVEFLTARPQADFGAVLLLDDAHHLPADVLEEVRMLSNLVRDGRWCAHLILVGQADLEENLNTPRMDSFQQRLAARCYLDSFSRDETHNYLNYCLTRANSTLAAIFEPAAVERIWTHTAGNPRVLNQLCDHALVLAAAGHHHQIDAAGIDEAWSDLQQLPEANWEMPQPTTDDFLEFGSLSDSEPRSDSEPQGEPDAAAIATHLTSEDSLGDADEPDADEPDADARLASDSVATSSLSSSSLSSSADSARGDLGEETRSADFGTTNRPPHFDPRSFQSGDELPSTETTDWQFDEEGIESVFSGESDLHDAGQDSDLAHNKQTDDERTDDASVRAAPGGEAAIAPFDAIDPDRQLTEIEQTLELLTRELTVAPTVSLRSESPAIGAPNPDTETRTPCHVDLAAEPFESPFEEELDNPFLEEFESEELIVDRMGSLRHQFVQRQPTVVAQDSEQWQRDLPAVSSATDDEPAMRWVRMVREEPTVVDAVPETWPNESHASSEAPDGQVASGEPACETPLAASWFTEFPTQTYDVPVLVTHEAREQGEVAVSETAASPVDGGSPAERPWSGAPGPVTDPPHDVPRSQTHASPPMQSGEGTPTPAEPAPPRRFRKLFSNLQKP